MACALSTSRHFALSPAYHAADLRVVNSRNLRPLPAGQEGRSGSATIPDSRLSPLALLRGSAPPSVVAFGWALFISASVFRPLPWPLFAGGVTCLATCEAGPRAYSNVAAVNHWLTALPGHVGQFWEVDGAQLGVPNSMTATGSVAAWSRAPSHQNCSLLPLASRQKITEPCATDPRRRLPALP